ncbi:hypothetical protein GN958_ATG12709 [Phytophthora infestans]|uniref:Uncharacterized protein n=1 Tax=Phytophthora infestans TaxID=4787 RepID=A0A8S9UC37_PHYIN|nr:hypothetical protein GN958_ATG12709 [Phytophthora infestans]
MGQVADCIYGVITKQDNETPFEDFFVNLAGDGYANTIEFLYRRGHKETKLLGYALDNAVCADQMEVLRMILSTGRVTQDRIGETLLIAARHGNFSPVEFLVQNSRISDRQTKKAFENASKLAISKYLLDKLDDPAGSVETAFRNAAGSGHYTLMGTSERVAILKFLLSTRLVPRTVVNDSFIVVT